MTRDYCTAGRLLEYRMPKIASTRMMRRASESDERGEGASRLKVSAHRPRILSENFIFRTGGARATLPRSGKGIPPRKFIRQAGPRSCSRDAGRCQEDS
jgi:hypothetical protein